jgi:DNA-directed RNA polymerase specialized sigma24 family protein
VSTSRDGENGGPPTNPNQIPSFWIRSTDDRQRLVDPRIHELARRMWPWAFRHVQRELHDGPMAAEILETVVFEVSARFREQPEVGRNLNGYLITAFSNRVRWLRVRYNRLGFEGLSHELEENYRLKSSDLNTELEWRLTLDVLLTLLPLEIRHTLHLRMLGFSWKEVSRILGLSVKQAKLRYYYGLQKAYGDLLEGQHGRIDAEDGD